nr:hypothetical protein [Deinococcus deserti]
MGTGASSASDLGYRDAADGVSSARAAGAVVVSKDSGFPDRVTSLGSSRQLLYITCGHTSTRFLKQVFEEFSSEANRLPGLGKPVVELGDALADSADG